jgi:hypothetical protein
VDGRCRDSGLSYHDVQVGVRAESNRTAYIYQFG